MSRAARLAVLLILPVTAFSEAPADAPEAAATTTDAAERVETAEVPATRREAEALLRQADDAFLEGAYADAARMYRVVAEAGFGTADVWYNLGNAAWHEGRLGGAVLAWERALRLDPRHEDARANLRHGRSMVVDQVVGATPPPLVERVGARLHVGAVAWGLAAAWGLTVLFVLARRRATRRRGLLAFAAALGVMASAVLGSLTGVAAWYHERVERAVILEPVVQVRSGPAPRFDAAFEIHEGHVVRVTGREGPYLRVRLDNGLSGWVLRRSAEII